MDYGDRCKRICIQCKDAYHSSRQEYEEFVHGKGMVRRRIGPHLASSTTPIGVCTVDEAVRPANEPASKCEYPFHELRLPSKDMKQLIRIRSRIAEVLTLATKEGMVALVQDGIRKVLQGMTTYRQVPL